MVAGIAGAGAWVIVSLDPAVFGGVAGDNLCAAVRRAIVYADRLPIGKVLGCQAV